MKEFEISQGDAGRRMDKYAMHILSGAPASFTYKMLRKKNITLNGKKATGSEILCAGDKVAFYLADDTFGKFTNKPADQKVDLSKMPPVIYEDDDILIVDKPSGMLSQKSSSSDISLNEICLSYVKESGVDTSTYTPSICNRLDRNTSGLVTFAKTYRGSVMLSEAFRDRTIHKYYNCIVSGAVDKDLDLKAGLTKDTETNTVTVTDDGGKDIHTKVHPIRTFDTYSLLEIELITGKTHQIRAHLAYVGFPLIGDIKYGNKAANDIFRKKFGISSQLLCCTKMVFPDDDRFGRLSNATITTNLPDEFCRLI